MSKIKELESELDFYKKKFIEFTDITISLHKEKDLDNLLCEIVHYARKFTHADAGTLYTFNDEQLSFRVIQNSTLKIDLNSKKDDIQWNDIEVSSSNSNLAAVYCALHKKVIHIDNIYDCNDYDFSGTKLFDEKNNYKSVSMLVIPVINPENNKLIGVLQLINKLDSKDVQTAFSKEDTNTALSLAYHSASILVRLEGELERLRELNELLQKQKNQLEHLANTDQLTNIANRLKFNDTLKTEFKLATTNQISLGFIIFDIDHFKKVNDTYGHKIGDYVLCEVVKVVNSQLEDEMLFARWGGEEFVILLPNFDDNKSHEIAEKLRLAISSHTFKHVEKITCSFGITTYKGGDDEETLINRADEALYEAKNCGRNCIKLK